MGLLKAVLNLGYRLALTFPKFFSKFFVSAPHIHIILRYLPEIVTFIKGIVLLVDRGYNEAQLKKRLNLINEGISNPDRQQAAKDIKDALTFD